VKDEWRRVLCFLAVGAVNTGFGYVCYAGFVLAGGPLWLSVGGSTVLGFVFNFVSYGRHVFHSTSLQRLPRFLLFSLGLGGLNLVLLRLLARAGLGALLAQAVLLPVLALCSYLGLCALVFHEQGARAAP
jgi:putative flippase GtrA